MIGTVWLTPPLGFYCLLVTPPLQTLKTGPFEGLRKFSGCGMTSGGLSKRSLFLRVKRDLYDYEITQLSFFFASVINDTID